MIILRTRPKVEVIDAGEKKHLVITRGDGGTCTSHKIRGSTEKQKIENMLNDRKTAEHLP